MLNRVEIKNFRSCRDVVLDKLGPMTVLVGRNAVGKTNILRAIDWVARWVTAGESETFLAESSAVSLSASLSETTYHYEVDCTHDEDWTSKSPGVSIRETLKVVDHNGEEQEVFTRKVEEVLLGDRQKVTIAPSARCVPALLAILPENSPTVRVIAPFYSFLAGLRYSEFSEETSVERNVVLQSQYQDWVKRHLVNGSADRTSIVMKLLHASLTGDPRLEEIRQILGPNGLNLINLISIASTDVPETEPKKARKIYFVNFQPAAADILEEFDFGNLSSGTQRTIGTIVSLLVDQPTVMLLEHPEDEIHRGLLRKLIGVLEAYSDLTQLIITSHSAVVFNALHLESVRLVSMEEGLTKVRGLTELESHAAERFLEEEGSLADFIETVED